MDMGKIRFYCDENSTIKFKIKDIVQMCLSGLEAFLDNISEKNPSSLNIIIKVLTSRFEKTRDFNISLNSEYKQFQEFPKLVDKSINMILSLVKFTEYQPKSIEEEINLKVTDIIHTLNHFEYYFIDSLLEIMPFQEVIKYYQNFVNELTQSRKDPSNYLNSLQDLASNFKAFSEKWHDLEATLEIIHEGKMVYKVKKCRWAEDLKHFEPEIGYTLMCHQDFERVKNFNPHFVLTRKHTLMESGEYCDFCYHDTRNIKDISHPSKEFWKEFS